MRQERTKKKLKTIRICGKAWGDQEGLVYIVFPPVSLDDVAAGRIYFDLPRKEKTMKPKFKTGQFVVILDEHGKDVPSFTTVPRMVKGISIMRTGKARYLVEGVTWAEKQLRSLTKLEAGR